MAPVAEVYNRTVQCQSSRGGRGRGRPAQQQVDVKPESAGSPDDAIQVCLELGHRAILRSRPTAEGFTHDWVVYVRGADNSSAQHFVDKVEFHLHESFPKSRRVVKEPPYQVAETGYGGFAMPVDVYLKNNVEPKKIRFQYELFLGAVGPVSHSRCEKITFQNPSPLFRERLLRGGGLTPSAEAMQDESAFDDAGAPVVPVAALADCPAVHPQQSVDHVQSAAAVAASARCNDTSLERMLEDIISRDGDARMTSTPINYLERPAAAAVDRTRPSSYLQQRLHCRVSLNDQQHPSAPVSAAACVQPEVVDDSRLPVEGQSCLDDVVVVGWEKKTVPEDIEEIPSTPVADFCGRNGVTVGKHRAHAFQQQSSGTALTGAIKRGRGRPRKFPLASARSGVDAVSRKRTSRQMESNLIIVDEVTRKRFIQGKESTQQRVVVDVHVDADKSVIVRSKSPFIDDLWQQRKQLAELPVNVYPVEMFPRKVADKGDAMFPSKALRGGDVNSGKENVDPAVARQPVEVDRAVKQATINHVVAAAPQTIARPSTAVTKSVHFAPIPVRSAADGQPKNSEAIVPPPAMVEPEVEAEIAPRRGHFELFDFDESLPLFESLGRPLSCSTPIKHLMSSIPIDVSAVAVAPVPTAAVPAAAVPAAVACSSAEQPSKPRGARLRFRPLVKRQDDEEDEDEKVELARLATIVRPGEAVRAFRSTFQMAAALAAAASSTTESAAAPCAPTASAAEQSATCFGSSSTAARKRPVSDQQLCHQPAAKRLAVEARPAPIGGPAVQNSCFPSSQPEMTTSVDICRPASVRPVDQPERPASTRQPEAVPVAVPAKRAPNGMPVNELLTLQRKLSTLSDVTVLRRVVQIIGETGRYCVSDVTFDFDLCNLDPFTVRRLIDCIDSCTAGR